MNNETNNITRREALISAIQSTVVASLTIAPVITWADIPTPLPESKFVPENDYPYFGYEPDTLRCQEDS